MHALKGVTALPFLTSAPDGYERLTSCSCHLSLGEKGPVINLIGCYMDIAAGFFEEGVSLMISNNDVPVSLMISNNNAPVSLMISNNDTPASLMISNNDAPVSLMISKNYDPLSLMISNNDVPVSVMISNNDDR
jgi:hypothetical protein